MRRNPNKQSVLSFPWLPYAAGVGGSLICLLTWLFLPSALIDASSDFHAWIILSLGVLLSILAGLAIRLTQLTRERKKSYEIIDENFKKEIAERLHAEETKQKLEKALLQGQKLQAMGTLAGGIAHDFNNILYAIIGYVELTREEMTPDSLPYKNLGKVLEGCKRGQELVARILTFSRRQQHDFKPICIKETMEGVLGLLKPTIPASVNIQFESMAEDSVILGNQTQLHQVIVNLINNAVDAMDGEGNVKITLGRISSEEKIFTQFHNIIKGMYCKLELTDTGHGMDQATLGRIFEPFFTTKEVGKGTGLGLATVHSIIKEHQGEIVVKSQLGHGTTFTLLLPENKNGQNTAC
ncbi:MAG TPA: ATP-binding protein [Gammaproteobacteria bacterium]|nr:ATP-binding protein [Gammaproteobacteria bacterium]